MPRLRLPRAITFAAAAGALAAVLLAAPPLGAGPVQPSWVAQVPPPGPEVLTNILGAGTLADGSVLTVLGNWEGFRFVHASASGELLGTARFWAPSFYDNGFLLAVVEPGGDVVVGGGGKSSGGDYWVMRFDGRTGAWRWDSPFIWSAHDGRAQRITALAVDGDGDVLVTGYAEGALTDAATLKLDGATGELLWGPVVFDSGVDDGPAAVSVDEAGNVAGVGAAGIHPDWHLFAVQYDGATGEEAWRFEWKGAKRGRAVLRQRDGGLIVSGEPAAGVGTALVALSPEGVLRWSKILDSPDSAWRYAALALANARGREGEAFFVAGVSGTDQVVWKLSAGSGWRIWGPVVRPGTAGSSQYQPAVAATPDGDLLVVQSELLAEPPTRTYVYALHGTSGKLRWGPLVFPRRHSGMLRSLVTDALGNPFVIANGTDSRDSPPLLTFARVSRSDGSFLSGPAQLPGGVPTDSPKSVLVDARGDVVTLVTGSADTPQKTVVAKLDGLTGRLHWDPAVLEASRSDTVRIGLDPSGDVFWAATVGAEVAYGKLRGDTGLPAWGPVSYAGGSSSLAGLAVAGSDLALLVRTSTADGTLLQVLKARGDTGALAYPPAAVSPMSGGYSPDRESLVYRAGVLAACTSRTALLDAATGAIRWGPVSTPDAGPCALDDSGNLYRPTSVWDPDPGTWFEKRLATNGSVLWSTFLSGSYVTAVAVDPAGDVAIAGAADTPSRLEVRKLAGATGSPVWGPVRWEDPASVFSIGAELAIAPSGAVVVLGSTRDVTAWNALVLRLAGASGELLGPPLLFDGGTETYPSALGLRGESPVIGVESSVLGAAVVSWPEGPVPFDVGPGLRALQGAPGPAPAAPAGRGAGVERHRM